MGISIVRIPFGMNETSSLVAETDRERFNLELRDVNGAPILSYCVGMAGQPPHDPAGTRYIYAPGLMIASQSTYSYIIEGNQAWVNGRKRPRRGCVTPPR